MYAKMVKEHYRKYRPHGSATMTDADFARIAEEIEQRIDQRTADAESRIPATLDGMERIGAFQRAAAEAQRAVLEEMLPPAEDDEMARAEAEARAEAGSETAA
jgi:hypothetical protein